MINNSLDKSIVALLQGDLRLESRPFQGLAEQLHISEQEIVERIIKMQQKGILRRWGAILRHQQAGYLANAMVAWKVKATQADEVGKMLSGFDNISHCYLRKVPNSFPYNLFTMVHAQSDKELQQLVSEISRVTNLNDYIVIKSLKEYKKASMKYV
jgi:DNA-binding Lrp family transcriptional regulator